MSKKENWAEVDKRIRERRPSWTKEERQALAKDLQSLPDHEGAYDYVEIPQPALAAPEEEPGDGEQEDGEQPN